MLMAIAYAMSGKEHNETNRQGEPTSKDQTHTSEDAPETTVIKPDTPPAETNKTYTVKQKHDALDYCLDTHGLDFAFDGINPRRRNSLHRATSRMQWHFRHSR
jgi:hypothetical protein